ncbi:MAG: ion transporter [Bacteroidota bacterium]|nr:ion transporter [Bacteroidota bacterium]
MTHTHTREPEEISFLNLLIILLSVYVLMALVADTFFKLPPQISHLLVLVDDGICLVFLFDFLIRFRRAPNKLAFMKWGWIDLISSIPTISILRAGRMFRLFRLIRVLRAFRSVRHLANHIFRRRTQGALTTASMVAVLMILFSSIAILEVEKAPNSNIKSAEDAIWWSYVTITTVGYGDKYPVTTEGRIIAALLMTVGVALFGTFTAYLASWFIGETQKENKKES